jgi:hypothetical protein
LRVKSLCTKATRFQNIFVYVSLTNCALDIEFFPKIYPPPRGYAKPVKWTKPKINVHVEVIPGGLAAFG